MGIAIFQAVAALSAAYLAAMALLDRLGGSTDKDDEEERDGR